MIKLEHELYKASEVAKLLRLNTKTLYGWLKKGRAAAIRTPTGGIRFRRDEVLRLLEENGQPGVVFTSEQAQMMADLLLLKPDVAGGEGVDKHPPHE